MAIDYRTHFPVMLPEVLANLCPCDGGLYVDATFGNGGYSEAILSAANCRVIALDRDPGVWKRAEELRTSFGSRFEFRAGKFGSFADLVSEEIDGAVFDIGVSSMQLDQAKRGFSFAKDAPLDMRMSQSGQTAADLVNTLPEKELADLIYRYGEERKSRQIASKIVAARRSKKIETTKELAEIVYSVLRRVPNAIDPATRTFQALRIAVNDELGELESGLDGATCRLKSGGRLVVVDFHSLEDRIVKNFFKNNTGRTRHVSRYAPRSQEQNNAIFKECSKVILPSEEELQQNSRSRSAKLRFAVKQ